MSRVHTLRATRNEHNWTCTVPWHVFLLCVKTLQMTMTMIREVETTKQISRGTCSVTVVLSKAGNACPKAHTTKDVALSGQKVKKMRYNFRWSPSPVHADLMFMDPPMTQTSPAEFQSDRSHTETDSPAIRDPPAWGAFDTKVAIRLRRDPIMLCCDQCKWYCAACCGNSERHLNREKTTDTRTPVQGPIASRDDGAIFLTAAKTHQRIRTPGVTPHLGGFLLRTQDMVLFRHRVRRDEQTVRVCAVNASLIPIRRKAYFFQFFKIKKTFLTLK